MARNIRGFGGIITVIFFVVIVVLGLFMFKSPMFETNSPTIKLEDKIFWNLKKPIPIEVSDDSGIKFVRVSLDDGTKSINIANENFEIPQKNVKLDVVFPKTGFFGSKDKYTLVVEATDKSYWKLTGNTATKKAVVSIDTKRPEIYVINQSYSISKGGAAAVVFRANDDGLKRVYIKTNYGKEFIATPFYKNGYYAALVAWPVSEKNFRAEVVAEDYAGNVSNARIRYFLKDRVYKESTIELKDNFIDGKIEDLTNLYAKDPSTLSRLDKFKFVNETLRIGNEDKIRLITSKVPENMLENFYIKPFFPLNNAKAVASFGDHRFYYYGDKKNVVSESWHMGIDFASVAQAKIVSNNPSQVVFANENGIYGLNLILYHGFGLYSLYGHCSNLNVSVGDVFIKEQNIANTGTTGLALGDHLHFGMIVQGIEVRPEEWMDQKWMKENIFDILNSAKKILMQSK